MRCFGRKKEKKKNNIIIISKHKGDRFFMHMCVPSKYVCVGILSGQKTASDPLKLVYR